MKFQRVVAGVSVINLALLVVVLVQFRGIRRNIDGTVLRGKGLQIVDDQGRVRASISVLPENEKYRTEDGGPWPETVLLRLITAEGRPNVKLAATERGAGLLIGGKADPTYVQIKAEMGEVGMKMINGEGKEMGGRPGESSR